MNQKSLRRAIIDAVTHINTNHPKPGPEPSPARAPNTESDIERELDDMAHALRSPLTALQGGLDLLNDTARDALDEIPRRALDLALSATRRLTTLIDDTLLLARHRAGRLELVFEVGPARDVIDEALRLYRSQNPHDERHNPEIDIHCTDFEVVADTERVATVICRLIALVAQASGRVQITVSPRGDVAVFELLGDVSAVTKRSRGTETILSACRAVIEEHGGTFSINPGRLEGSGVSGDGAASELVARFTLLTPG